MHGKGNSDSRERCSKILNEKISTWVSKILKKLSECFNVTATGSLTVASVF